MMIGAHPVGMHAPLDYLPVFIDEDVVDREDDAIALPRRVKAEAER